MPDSTLILIAQVFSGSVGVSLLLQGLVAIGVGLIFVAMLIDSHNHTV